MLIGTDDPFSNLKCHHLRTESPNEFRVGFQHIFHVTAAAAAAAND